MPVPEAILKTKKEVTVLGINKRIKDKVNKDGSKAVKKWNDRFQKNKRKLEEENQDKKDVDK